MLTHTTVGTYKVSSPTLVCAGCGQPTGLYRPICDDCIRLTGGTPAPVCMLCESGLTKDKHGQHVTKTGGYAGRCLQINQT